MGAETTVYVKRSRIVTEWVEVQSVTLDDAIKDVKSLENTFQVFCAQYDEPEGWE